MSTLVIKSFPEELHDKLREFAAKHRRSVTQETIYLLEEAMLSQETVLDEAPKLDDKDKKKETGSFWSRRELLPEYEAALKRGAFSGGRDSTEIISEERDQWGG